MFYQILQSLCKQQGVKITNVVSDLKISSGNLSKWKAGGVPKGSTLEKLADYFHVSTDFLLGRESPTCSMELSPKEEELILCYRQASPDDRAMVELALKKYRANPAASDKSVV